MIIFGFWTVGQTKCLRHHHGIVQAFFPYLLNLVAGTYVLYIYIYMLVCYIFPISVLSAKKKKKEKLVPIFLQSLSNPLHFLITKTIFI